MKKKRIIIILTVLILLILVVILHIKGVIYDYQYTVDIRSGTANIIKYTGNSKEVVVPTRIGPFEVTDMDMDTYADCSSIEILYIQPEERFSVPIYKIPNLKTVEYIKGIDEIELMKIRNCDSLERIIFPEGTERICGFCEDCKNLKDVTIPDSVYFCSVSFYNTLYYNEFREFEYYSTQNGCLLFYNGGYNEIVIPEGIKQLAWLGNSNDDKIETIYFPETIEYGGMEVPEGAVAFFGCEEISFGRDDYEEEINASNIEGTVVAPVGSYMEKFCKKYDIDFRVMTEEEESIWREKTEAAAKEITYQE